MRKFLLPLLLIATISLNAQVNLNQGNIIQDEYYKEIGFEYVKNKIIVKAKVNGVIGRYILDTGAPLVIFSSENLPVYERDTVTDANGNKVVTEFIRVSTVSVGGITYKDIPAVKIDIEGTPMECLGVDGLIGSNLFRFGAIKVDMENKKLAITTSFKKFGLKKKDGVKMKVNKVQSRPTVKVKLNKKSKVVLIDSGSDSFCKLSKSEESKLISSKVVKSLYEATGNASASVGGFDNSKGYKVLSLDQLILDDAVFKNNIITTTPSNSSRIGMELLEQGNFVMDFKKKRFFFMPKSDELTFKEKSFGFDVMFEGEKKIIAGVWKGSEADKAGMKKGDELVNIKGIDIQNTSSCDLLMKTLPQILDKDEITVSFKDESGSVKEVTLDRIKL